MVLRLRCAHRPHRPRDERGAVALMVGAMTIMIFLVAALVVDLGLARDTKRQSQNGVDAAALAAGNALYPDGGTCTTTNTVVSKACLNDAVAEAKAYAQVNFGVTSWTGCAAAPSGYYVLTGAPSCISFDQQDQPSKVRVVMPTRNVDTSFGGVTGVQNIPVSTAARATLEPGQLIECSLCVLGSMMHNIGNGDLSVINVTGGGGIHINGSLRNGHSNSIVTAGLGGTITTYDSRINPISDPPQRRRHASAA